MAGWVCQTKKLLVSAFTTIAGELEQTVQDFNDAVHNLSTKRTTKDKKDVAVATNEGDDPAELSETCTYDFSHNHPAFLARHHQVATTRQPQRSSFPSALNSRLSKSSPSLSQSKLPVLQTRLSASSGYALASKSIHHSKLSQSSPCLIHSLCPVKRAHKTVTNSCQDIPEHGHPDVHAHTTTEENVELPHTKSGSVTPTSCLRGTVQKITHNLSQKRPGKVIRAESSSLLADNCKTPSWITTDDNSPSQVSTVKTYAKALPNDGHNVSDLNDSDNMMIIRATSPVLVENETRFRLWVRLGPLTRMLSFAFTQVASVVLMLADEPHASSEQKQSSSREILSLTFPAREVQNIQQITEVIDKPSPQNGPADDAANSPEESGNERSSLVRSPYSTDSFEIIETSSLDDFSDPVAKIPHEESKSAPSYCSPTRNSPKSVSPFEGSTDMSSSAEFVNFDFRYLISNRQSNKLNPMLCESEGSQVCQSVDVICEDVNGKSVTVVKETSSERSDSYTSVSGEKWQAHKNIEEHGDDDDDDDDGSVSFTIISSEDEEFIFF